MSRPPHSQYNDNLFDTYLNTIMKTARKTDRSRIDTGRTMRDKSVNRSNNNQLVVSRPVTKSRIEEMHPKPESQELVRKEVYNNSMATVEVTVRTVAPKGLEGKPGMEDNREPWSKLLANRKSDDNIPGTFGNFDPLRTLHFLSKELQMKLQSVCPSDTNVQQIINDMNNAIQRLPPDIITQFTTNSYVSASAGDAEVPINFKKTNSNHNMKRKCSQESQTVVIGDADTRMMQKKLEDSANKLEANCRDMEDLSNKLRRERDELESMLVVEKETVINLRKQMKDAIAQEEEKLTKEMRKVVSDRDSLKVQVTDLQTQLESQVGQTTEDIRVLVESLKNKQLAAEQENTMIRNELTIVKLERDKINVLLDCKDKQLKELRNELECIQQLISNQLHELRTKPTISTTSTLSSASQFWNIPSSRSQKFGTSIHELFLNNDIMRKMLSTKDLQAVDSGTTNFTLNDKCSNAKYNTDDIQVIPQKERSVTSKIPSTVAFSDATISVDYNKSSHMSIKDVFSEIKRQAFEKYNVTTLEANSPELLDESKSSHTKSSRCESRASQSS